MKTVNHRFHSVVYITDYHEFEMNTNNIKCDQVTNRILNFGSSTFKDLGLSRTLSDVLESQFRKSNLFLQHSVDKLRTRRPVVER